MFLIRAAFWLTVVVLLIPADPPSGDAAPPQVNAFQAIGAARDTVADVSGFCGRNPDTCVTGSAVLDLLARKVRYGARKVGEYFDSSEHRDNASPAHNGTLTNEDTSAPWHPPKRPRSA